MNSWAFEMAAVPAGFVYSAGVAIGAPNGWNRIAWWRQPQDLGRNGIVLAPDSSE